MHRSPVHGLPACRPTRTELVALPRRPPRQGRDLLPDPGELPPPARPPRVPDRYERGKRHGPHVRFTPTGLLGRGLPPQPRGPLRGDRFRNPRPHVLPDPRRPHPVEAAGPARHPPPRGRDGLRDRGRPRGGVRPRPRGGDRREPRCGRRHRRPHRRLRPDPRRLPSLSLLLPPDRGDREASEVRGPEVAGVRGGERVREPRDRGLLPGARGGEPEDGRVHDRPRREDDPRPRPRRPCVPGPLRSLPELGANPRGGSPDPPGSRPRRSTEGVRPSRSPRRCRTAHPATAVPGEHDEASPAPAKGLGGRALGRVQKPTAGSAGRRRSPGTPRVAATPRVHHRSTPIRSGIQYGTSHCLLLMCPCGHRVRAMCDSARLSARPTRIATAVSLFVFALVLSAPVALGCGDAGCSPGTYSGRAYGAWIHTGLSGDTTVADTGDLPPEGGVLDATFDHLDTPVATATLFFSVTSGLNGVAASAASTSYVTLVPGDGVPLVTSTFAFAWTSATCDYVLGASEVAGLYVMGKEVLVTNEANQIVDVPGVLTLKINEVIVSQDGTCNSITVNALHLYTANSDIVVSHAHS